MDLCRYFDVALEPEGDFKDDLEKILATIECNMFYNYRAINDCLLANGVLNGLRDKKFFNKDHIFYEKNCVFTGKLEKFTRQEAAQIVANIGGHCENTITKNTNFLIVGDMDYRNGMQVMEAEKGYHLGYEKSARSDSDNARNGCKSKCVNSSYGNFSLEVPQERKIRHLSRKLFQSAKSIFQV